MSDRAESAQVAVRARRREAWLAVAGGTCGGGIEQPNGVTCREPGTWSLRGYLHSYCPIHADERLKDLKDAARYTGGKSRR